MNQLINFDLITDFFLNNTLKIPIIDLFAGPGGLGEGFMSLKNDQGNSIFDIKLSPLQITLINQ